jgi:hypothetical protein
MKIVKYKISWQNILLCLFIEKKFKFDKNLWKTLTNCIKLNPKNHNF